MALPTLYAAMRELDTEVQVIITFDTAPNIGDQKPIVLYFGPDDEEEPNAVASFHDNTIWFHDPPDQLPLFPLESTPNTEEPEPSKASI